MNDKPTPKPRKGRSVVELAHSSDAKTAQKQVSPTGALMRFLAMGDTRTLPKLAAQLEAEGQPARLQWLRGTSAKEGWTELAKEFDANRRESLQEELMLTAKGMDLRQALLGQSMQTVADKSVRGMMDAGVVLSPRDIPRFVEVGSRMERLAAGKATSRNEGATYNTVIMPVLTLFQQIVSGLPEQTRDMITRQFADGVNQIRDALIVNDDAEETE